MSRAFVAGATGYVGREVVRVLRARAIETVAHVRPDSPRLAEWRDRFAALGAEVDATSWEPAAVEATLRRRQPTAMFSLLGTTRARAARAARAPGAVDSYQSVDRDLTLLLYRAALACGATPRFCYLSSIGVREGTTNAYLAARAEVERVLVRGPLPWVIARPSFITGPDREEFRLLERLGARLTDGVLGVVGVLDGGRLRRRYGSTTASRLASALVRLTLDGGTGNQLVESEALNP